MTDKPVLFKSGIPSSFYIAPILLRCPVTGRLTVFDSNERYFHVSKIPLSDLDDREAIVIAQRIRTASSSQEAKRLGREIPLDAAAIKLWDEQYAPIAMLTCNLAKFRRHPHCREWLMDTGTREIIEHRPDPRWGDNMNGTGRNQLGKILMLVRDVLR
jgi:N-glycosidase YbiA